MGTKEIKKIDIEHFQREMTATLARTKFLELEWVNERMIDLVYKEAKRFNDAYIILRDEIYKRMNEYRKIMLAHTQPSDDINVSSNKRNLKINATTRKIV